MNFAFLVKAPLYLGLLKQAEYHNKMFKNNTIDNFWVDWTVEQNVNISLSDYPTTGTAS